jgi:hypothetical protein
VTVVVGFAGDSCSWRAIGTVAGMYVDDSEEVVSEASVNSLVDGCDDATGAEGVASINAAVVVNASVSAATDFVLSNAGLGFGLCGGGVTEPL